MEIFFGLIIFIMGTFFGSFFTLAVYRIPRHQDITHTRSYCPKCDHKLGFFDMFPVLSYIFLGGKCRYCGQKIRIRYLLLELLSGIVFVLAFFSLQITIFDLSRIPNFVFFVFSYTTLALIAGIDNENKKINFSILIFGGITQIIYILYLYIIEKYTSMYRYSIYMLIFIIIFVFSVISQKKKENYKIQLLTLFTYILTIIDIKGIIFVTSVEILYQISAKIKKTKNLSPGFIACISAICYKIVENIILYRIILL